MKRILPLILLVAVATTSLAAQDGPWRAQDGGPLPFADAAEAIQAALGPYLEKAQIQALMKRHRILLHRLEEKIAEHGEADVLYDIPRLG